MEGRAPKGLAVRQLKCYASWVQTVNQNLLLLASSAASDGNIGVKKSTHIGEVLTLQSVVC